MGRGQQLQGLASPGRLAPGWPQRCSHTPAGWLHEPVLLGVADTGSPKLQEKSGNTARDCIPPTDGTRIGPLLGHLAAAAPVHGAGGDAAAPAPPGIKNAQRPRTDPLTLLFSALSDFPPPAGNCILIHCPQGDAEGASFTPRHPRCYPELARSHPHFMSRLHLCISEHRFIYFFLSKPTAAPARIVARTSDQQPDREPLILSLGVF